MAVEKAIASSSLAEVVDRILDKGIVIDAWVRVSLVGIELLAIEARIVVAGVDTYLKYAEAVGLTAVAAAPA
ncbi:MAG: gas vesicle structural protein GvpA [Anaerolineae bacterium]|nr:gas vesicle structural protein GvpA [Anaerolineae bacterium]